MGSPPVEDGAGPQLRAAREALMSGFNLCGDDLGCCCEDAQETAGRMVAAVLNAQGLAGEGAIRERVAAEIVDVRRTGGPLKGAAGSSRRRIVDEVLRDAARRVRSGEHAEDQYPDGWLAVLDADGSR